MIEKYYSVYKEDQGFNEKMTFKMACLYTLFDSVFIGLKFGVIVSVGWLFTSIFYVEILKKFAVDVCPLLK